MKNILCGVLIAVIGATGCAASPCDPGFEPGDDGNCYRRSYDEDDDTALPDATPETGETGETGETSTTERRDITVEGSYAGANIIVLGLDTTPKAAVDAGLLPNAKAIMDGGLVLDQHQCGAAWTAPCMISWALGTSAPVLGADAFVPESATIPNPVLSDDVVTFADVLSGAGYQNTLISQNGFFGTSTNTDQGYTYYSVKGFNEGVAKTLEVIGEAVESELPFYVHYHGKGGHEPYIDEQEPEGYYSSCLGDPLPDGIDFRLDHQVVVVAERWDSWSSADQTNVLNQLNCVYAAQLEWIDDEEFGVFWSQLDGLGALDNTIVLVMSDHGEEAGEHLDATSGWPNFGHNQSVFQQSAGAISAFWAKDIAPGTVAQVTDHGDIAPTILQALGISVPERMGGLPVGEIPSSRIPLRYKCGGVQGAVPTEDMAAVSEDGNILHLSSDGGYESYQLRSDPGELAPTGEIDETLQNAVDALEATAQDEHWCG